MQSKEQFETSQLIEYKDYEDKSINNIRDILALESESGAEGGQRPRNTWLTPIGQPVRFYKSNIFSTCSLVDNVMYTSFPTIPRCPIKTMSPGP